MEITNKLFSYDRRFSKGQMRTPSAEILQIAELSLIRGGEITAHSQNCDEITYAISGKAVMYSEGIAEEISAGQIHYIRKGEKHRIVADSDKNFRYMCIGYTPSEKNKQTKHIVDTDINRNAH